MLRECIGDSGTLMFDANQRWSLPVAVRMSHELALYKPTWIEEPTHLDDIHGHASLSNRTTHKRMNENLRLRTS